jgi:hypothetical protein
MSRVDSAKPASNVSRSAAGGRAMTTGTSGIELTTPPPDSPPAEA